MSFARDQLGAAAASNGKIYAIGGCSSSASSCSGGTLNAVEQYDPVTNVWTAQERMLTARYSLGVATANNGKIYAIGGRTGSGYGTTDAVEEFDPGTHTWTECGAVSTSGCRPMLTSRGHLAVVAAANGKVYAFGGGDGNVALSTVEEYDPATNLWASKAAMPAGGRASPFAVLAANGRIYVMGGITSGSNSSIVEEYDPYSNMWTNCQDVSTTGCAPLPTGMSFGAAVSVNGRIFAVNGSVVQEYDPAANTWAQRGAAPPSSGQFGLALGANGRLYTVGGESGGVRLPNVAEGTLAYVTAP